MVIKPIEKPSVCWEHASPDDTRGAWDATCPRDQLAAHGQRERRRVARPGDEVCRDPTEVDDPNCVATVTHEAKAWSGRTSTPHQKREWKKADDVKLEDWATGQDVHLLHHGGNPTPPRTPPNPRRQHRP